MMRYLQLALACLAVAAAFPGTAAARPDAQFSADCDAPTYRTDELVCADAELRRLDAELRARFDALVAGADDPSRLEAAQASWFLGRSECAFQAAHRQCALDAYQRRLDALRDGKVAEPVAARAGATPDWESDVRPVLERRCVTCHACYDAPCQLKLTSYEGLARGANPELVYDGARLRAAAPTRLYVDARNPAEWRTKGFHAVVPDAPAPGTPAAAPPDPQASVLYRMLRLKADHPQPAAGPLPAEVTLGLDRQQVCTAADGFDDFAGKQPLWGMPYGLPGLAVDEERTLLGWLAAGGPPPAPPVPSATELGEIIRWERFLNGASFKERLMSRYLYEHVFLAHLHFDDTPPRSFYRLVRSRTPPGEPIDEIPTVRPMDDPGPAPFWYRVAPEHQSVVAKDHVVYTWSPARMARYRALFLEADYEVSALPSYEPEVATNPLRAFAQIPVDSRYRFLLDDARFYIEGFIKGPVCRGQVALNVIEDQFWVFFFSPDRPLVTDSDEFLATQAGYLRLPAEEGNTTLRVDRLWTRYWKGQKRYLEAKQDWFRTMHATTIGDAMGYVWDGDGTNPSAALTVLRHTDSAFVLEGLWGDYPETAWIIDFPLLERIHYLLVAGFDVYGNVGHQLSTRIVMDFLRMEGEDHFLAMLPAAQRGSIRDAWYQGIRGRRARQFREPLDWLGVEVVTGYRTADPQRELYDHLAARVGRFAGSDRIHRCGVARCEGAGTVPATVESALRRMAAQRGASLAGLPDATLLRVRGTGPGEDAAFTLVLDKSYRNLTSMLEDEDRRSPDGDTLTIIPGYAVSYPNLFLVVDAAEIGRFAGEFTALRTPADFAGLVARYGVRRTDPEFWAQSDWFQADYVRRDAVEGGILDLNRYFNY